MDDGNGDDGNRLQFRKNVKLLAQLFQVFSDLFKKINNLFVSMWPSLWSNLSTQILFDYGSTFKLN